MRGKGGVLLRAGLLLCFCAAVGVFVYLVWRYIPRADLRYGLLAAGGGVCLAALAWVFYQRRQVQAFSNDVCETLDALLSGRPVQDFHPYEDTLTAKVQGKLMQFFDILNEGKIQSQRDKETIQSLVSDISHQVKTPIANLQLFTGILQQHNLPEAQRREFLGTLSEQIHKLDFLMQSLIKMSRLETGTFALHMETAPLHDTIARAMSTVWAKAEAKGISLSAGCDGDVTIRHDPAWTAEALGNILDNAVKYTPAGGSVTVTVRPWQFYTRIDISDTGIGIPESAYNAIFQRFYRAPEAAASEREGVGLGLYLANGIITRQKGYISVKSQVGAGTTFSVYLLS